MIIELTPYISKGKLFVNIYSIKSYKQEGKQGCTELQFMDGDMAYFYETPEEITAKILAHNPGSAFTPAGRSVI